MSSQPLSHASSQTVTPLHRGAKDGPREALDQFLHHNTLRRHAALAGLPAKGRAVLELLPLLLHFNTPGLPCFTPSATPVGLLNFQPNSVQRKKLNTQYSTTFRLEAPSHPSITALFFMGSAGSIGQTRRSDIDVWVCLPRALHKDMLPKLQRIEWWAASQGIELQAFAVDPKQFQRQGDVSFSPLLLDEFYRSGCWLAGAYPVWWVASNVDGEADLTRRLIRQHPQLRHHAWIDFGDLAAFSDDDLYVAAVRELENSVRNPYKSLIKLALLETYAAGWEPLSQLLKTRVLSGSQHTARDPYLLLADRIEAFFGNDTYAQFSDTERLAGLQRAWLIKTTRGNVRLQQQPELFERAGRWGYQQAELAHLQHSERWRLHELYAEDQRLQQLQQAALNFILLLRDRTQQVNQFAPLTHQRMLTVARRLHISQTQRPVQPALIPADYHAESTIVQQDQTWYWVEDGKQLLQAQSVEELIITMIDHGWNTPILNHQQRRNPNIISLFELLADVTPIWLMNSHAPFEAEVEGQDHTTLAGNTDPLDRGALHTTLNTRSVWITETPANGDTARTARVQVTEVGLLDGLLCCLAHPNSRIHSLGGLQHKRLAARLNHLLEKGRVILGEAACGLAFALQGTVALIYRDQRNDLRSASFDNLQQAHNALPWLRSIELDDMPAGTDQAP